MEEEGNMSTSEPSPLKIYFLPFPAAGHMNPMLNLARDLSQRGHHVTILTTPSNAKLLPKTQFHNHNIHTFNFPHNQVDLPPGIEHLSSANDNETARKICIAMNLLIPQIEAFVQQNPPHIFIPDFMFTRTFHLEIPILPFLPMPIFVACIIEAINSHPEVLLPSNPVPFAVPGDLPHPVTFPVNPSNGIQTMSIPFLQAKQNGAKFGGVIVNFYAELEQEYAEYYQKLTGIKVWHVGASSLMVDKRVCPRDEDDECLNWLDSKEADSVVYICFGSLGNLNKEQNVEIARGIEASGKGFLWVVPEEEDGSWMPKGFEERMREEKRGIVVRGWAPQVLILKHPAIGAFFTHCGANSVTEGICAGVPLITMPRFGDHFFIERLVTDVHGVGVEVGAWEWSMSPYDARKKVVSWERIEKAVRRVMEDGGGFTSTSLRKRAKEIQEKVCKAVQQGGSSYYDNLTTFMQVAASKTHRGGWSTREPPK